MICLGFDTSNYTTSIAFFDGETGENQGKLLDVPEGALGLRQSDALFSHVKQLPALVDALFERLNGRQICAIGASTRPRAVEGSYMPCFLAGESAGRMLASALDVPFLAVSHQQGHIAAAAWSSGQMALLDEPHLAWHLSGGTTELLYVTPAGSSVSAQIIGGTNDLSAGQLIDRAGARLGLSFPAGKALDALSQNEDQKLQFDVKRNGLIFSLSGVENKIDELLRKGETRENIAGFTFNTIAGIVERTTEQARHMYPSVPVLFSGGVASNTRLRERLSTQPDIFFAPPAYSTDNAMGVAILTYRAFFNKQSST